MGGRGGTAFDPACVKAGRSCPHRTLWQKSRSQETENGEPLYQGRELGL